MGKGKKNKVKEFEKFQFLFLILDEHWDELDDEFKERFFRKRHELFKKQQPFIKKLLKLEHLKRDLTLEEIELELKYYIQEEDSKKN